MNASAISSSPCAASVCRASRGGANTANESCGIIKGESGGVPLNDAMKLADKKKVLVGNSFPFSLVRCARLTVEQRSIGKLREVLAGAEVASFWGHANTRAAAEGVLGVPLAPRTERPAVTLSAEGLPVLDGETFDTCWLLSPDYPEGFRPAIGVEVGPEQIAGWHVLKLTWQ